MNEHFNFENLMYIYKKTTNELLNDATLSDSYAEDEKNHSPRARGYFEGKAESIRYGFTIFVDMMEKILISSDGGKIFNPNAIQDLYIFTKDKGFEIHDFYTDECECYYELTYEYGYAKGRVVGILHALGIIGDAVAYILGE